MGVWLHDHNCGMKCFRAGVCREVKLYGELHRFIPVLAAARGFRVGEIEIHHRPRRFGRSKYGVRRFMKGFLDLLTVKFLTGFGQRPQRDGLALICDWIFPFESRRDGGDLGASLCERNAWLEATNRRNKRDCAVAQRIPLLGGEYLLRHHRGHPYVRSKDSVKALKTFGPDPDDGERSVVELDGSSDNVRSSAESALPGRVAEHRHSRHAGRGVLAGKEEPAHERAEPESVKVIGGDDFYKDPTWVAFIGHRDGHGI